MREILYILLFLIWQITFCQTTSEKLIRGKIIVESGNVEGVTIVNLVNEKSTISDSNGEFYILAKADDLLVFTSINLEYHRKQIEEKDLKSDIIIIKMSSKITELVEVIVNNHPEINAVELGISPKGIKKYTPAERKLYTATSTSGDALLNYISGRTAMLKKEIEVEKKERSLMVFRSLFNDAYFNKTLKIPEDYLKGFQYYCIEDPKFREVVSTKDKIKIEIVIITLAIKYNEIISEKK